jgi:hypothetical protein
MGSTACSAAFIPVPDPGAASVLVAMSSAASVPVSNPGSQLAVPASNGGAASARVPRSGPQHAAVAPEAPCVLQLPPLVLAQPTHTFVLPASVQQVLSKPLLAANLALPVQMAPFGGRVAVGGIYQEPCEPCEQL